jgi:hypothetical protein
MSVRMICVVVDGMPRCRFTPPPIRRVLWCDASDKQPVCRPTPANHNPLVLSFLIRPNNPPLSLDSPKLSPSLDSDAMPCGIKHTHTQAHKHPPTHKTADLLAPPLGEGSILIRGMGKAAHTHEPVGYSPSSATVCCPLVQSPPLTRSHVHKTLLPSKKKKKKKNRPCLSFAAGAQQQEEPRGGRAGGYSARPHAPTAANTHTHTKQKQKKDGAHRRGGEAGLQGRPDPAQALHAQEPRAGVYGDEQTMTCGFDGGGGVG